MAFTEKRLAGPVAITDVAQTTLYTCPVSPTTTTVVKQIVLTNTSSVESKLVTINLVPSGGTVQTANRIFQNLSLSTNETVMLDMSLVMNSGDLLSIYVSGNTFVPTNVTVSGIENAGGMVISGLADSAVTTAKIANSNVTAAKLGPDAFLANNQAGALMTMEMM